MRARTMRWAILVLLVAVALQGAQRADSARVMLEAAKKKEIVDGDLDGAIKQYKSIVEKFKTDRAVVADALVHMADCYQKKGDAESRKIYERILREFSDQKDAVAIARSRTELLGTGKSQGGMTTRRLWLPDLNGADSNIKDADFQIGATISPDGRFMSFIDWVSGDLGLHEFASRQNRYLTSNNGGPSWTEGSAISRNGREIAYNWFKRDVGRYDLRVASLEGSGMPTSRVVFDKDDVEWVMPFDWSPDGRFIAARLATKSGPQLGLISASDGAFRVLLRRKSLSISKLFFSPDGKYLGFDLPVGENQAQRDVFIIPVEGGEPLPAMAESSDDTMMGWTPDGRHLLFASDRSGATALWTIPVVNGRPQGALEMIKSDISRFSLGVSASGSLYSAVPVGDRDMRIASVDFETGKVLSGPTRPIQSFVGTNSSPAWSPDGNQLAYKSFRSGLGSAYINNDVLGILSLQTGQIREFHPPLAYFNINRWSPDGRSVFVSGRNFEEGQQGRYQVDPETGKMSPAPQGDQNSPDGKRFRRDSKTDGIAFVEQDIVSGRERELIRRQHLGTLNLSPDRKYIATTDIDASGKTSTVLLISVDGGASKELLRVSQPQSFLRTVSWMPNSEAILVTKALDQNSERTEFWVIPIANGAARKIDIGATQFESVAVHYGTGRVAYVSGRTREEVWVLDNFLSAFSK